MVWSGRAVIPVRLSKIDVNRMRHVHAPHPVRLGADGYKAGPVSGRVAALESACGKGCTRGRWLCMYERLPLIFHCRTLYGKEREVKKRRAIIINHGAAECLIQSSSYPAPASKHPVIQEDIQPD